MHDLKAIGANITASPTSQASNKGLMGKSVLQTVRRSYESFRRDDVLPATYEIIYGHAWKAENAATKPQGENYQTVDFTS